MAEPFDLLSQLSSCRLIRCKFMRKDVNKSIHTTMCLLLVTMLVYILLSLFTSLRINLHVISLQELSSNPKFEGGIDFDNILIG